jgi:hypothetical protein
MQTADEIAVASLLTAAAALAVAVYAIFRGNRNTSAATVIALNEAIRQGWERFLPIQGDVQIDQLPELLNLFEVACAISLEGSLAGVSKSLMDDYLKSVIRMLAAHPITVAAIPALLGDKTTFQHIKKYLKATRFQLSVTVPLAWYESYQ